jgi:hypothetical protein
VTVAVVGGDDYWLTGSPILRGVDDDGGVISEKLGRGKHTFADTLHGVDLSTVLHGVNSKVNLRHGLPLLDGADGIIDLLVATGVDGGGGRLAFRVHVD